jgi:hypothetical protein
MPIFSVTTGRILGGSKSEGTPGQNKNMVRSDSKNTSSNKELEIFLSGKVTC